MPASTTGWTPDHREQLEVTINGVPSMLWIDHKIGRFVICQDEHGHDHIAMRRNGAWRSASMSSVAGMLDMYETMLEIKREE